MIRVKRIAKVCRFIMTVALVSYMDVLKFWHPKNARQAARQSDERPVIRDSLFHSRFCLFHWTTTNDHCNQNYIVTIKRRMQAKKGCIPNQLAVPCFDHPRYKIHEEVTNRYDLHPCDFDRIRSHRGFCRRLCCCTISTFITTS